MIHTEVVIPTARYQLQDQESNDRILAQDLDTIDELRDLSRIHIAAHQQRITKAYNMNIEVIRFQVGDLVSRKTFQNTKDPCAGILALKWDEPYLIDSKTRKEEYRLAILEGNVLSQPWNPIHLKAYFM